MKKTFFANALILAATSQAVRLLGILYISFLSSKIGAEGVGLYQLIVSVYALAATLASSGLGTAVSRLTAESYAKSGRRSTSDVVKASVIFGVFLGTGAALLLFFCADFIGGALLRDARAVPALKILSAGLLFVAPASCMRGYFYGMKKITKPAVQMILEQGVQLLTLFLILNAMQRKGIEYACFAAAASIAAAEAFSFLYGACLYAHERRKTKLPAVRDMATVREIFSIAGPLAASSYLRGALRTAENILIPSGIRKSGVSETKALSQFGLIGMAMPVLLFPSSFLSAMATLLIPELSEANALKNERRIRSIFSKVFQMTSAVSLLFCGLFASLAKDLGLAVYGSEQTGTLLLLLAPLVPLIYMDFITDAMLNALNCQVKTLKINILDYAIRICLVLLLLPKFGFWAYIPIFYFSTLLNAFLSIRALITRSGSRLELVNWVLKPLLCALVSGGAATLVFRLAAPAGGGWALIILKILLTTALYAALIIATKCINKDDLRWLKDMVLICKKTGAVTANDA